MCSNKDNACIKSEIMILGSSSLKCYWCTSPDYGYCGNPFHALTTVVCNNDEMACVKSTNMIGGGAALECYHCVSKSFENCGDQLQPIETRRCKNNTNSCIKIISTVTDVTFIARGCGNKEQCAPSHQCSYCYKDLYAAIKCYYCTSPVIGNCGEQFQIINIIHCNNSTMACIKYLRFLSTVPYLERGCGYEQACNLPNQCFYCYQDICNSSDLIKPKLIVPMLISSIILKLTIQHW
ncbi:hypothetical protein FQR65_LT01818 [Abscondita terminalis]|nr:hypothetical protein FQR65_LT01818 [Abscondita terminalis]